MRLKALTLHGFKTFVRRTQLDFEPGLTAVVGPNGSGKSNLADALRWVLGEQSLRHLRSRRTEDVLFAGGQGRPPAGMAEVGLTFDNTRRLVDLPYAEIAIARRAYRSGENEYYVNRERSRLRDVTDLLGQIGLSADGFAIVGQGAIDAALSLRAEDRRNLIEQAAVIGHLYARLDDSVRRLQDTQSNVNRLNDLVGELTPQLRTLERQARQARELAALRDEFRDGSIRWYAHRWSGPKAHYDRATNEQQAAEASAAQAAAKAAELSPALRTIQERLIAGQAQVVTVTEHLKEFAAERLTLQQKISILAERRRSVGERLDDFRRSSQTAERDLEREREILEKIEIELRDRLAQLATIESNVHQAESEAASWVPQRESRARQVKSAHEAANRARGDHASALASHRVAQERADRLVREIAERAEREAKLATEVNAVEERDGSTQRALSTAREHLDQLRAEQGQLAEKREQSQHHAASLATELAGCDREQHALQARHDALQSADESGVGYYAGVRAVLHAANSASPRPLSGIFGVVAKLVEASSETELAIETALGGHLQDVVVARWEDAEAAITHLKSSGAGRATFLPLNTIRPSRRGPPPNGPGVIGVAAELVKIDPQFQTISDYLLGQTLVVESLGVARRLLRECPSSWQIVTLDGDVARPTGVVTGGSPGVNRGTLARHRELRQTRNQLAEKTRERAGRAAAWSAAQAAAKHDEERLGELVRAVRAAEELLRRASADANETRRESEQARRNLGWHHEERQRLTEQREAATKDVALAATAAQAAAERVRQTNEEYETARTSLEQFEQETRTSVNALATLRSGAEIRRSQVVAGRKDQQSAKARIQSLQVTLGERQQRVTELEKQASELRTELEELQAQIARCAQAVEHESAALEALKKNQQQIQQDQAELESASRRWEAACHASLAEKQDAERRLERAAAEIDGVRQQLRLELGSVDETGLAAGRLRLTMDDGRVLEAPIAALPEPDRLRARLDTLRSRLRNNVASLDAVEEYEKASVRLQFLGDQVADLERAATTLRQTIDETRLTMLEKFTLTYAKVSEAFSRRFVDLFGGGTARLVLSGDDETSGVDVVAQPPGKRSQSLAQLSGGERALTAAALIFALIETNPPPFCVLDEVDAALDESNVGRFAGLLREMSAQSQCIVITHNRRTMEAATTIWGLTLEQRCESRVFSMALATSA